jgi:hypothetical protein
LAKLEPGDHSASSAHEYYLKVANFSRQMASC